MTKKSLIIGLLVVLCITAVCMVPSPTPTTYNVQQEDTTSFTPNSATGWSALSVYLNQDTPDSVFLGVILKQNSSMSWSAEQLIGTITNQEFIPTKIQRLSYDLFKDNTWTIRITDEGQCYLSQTKGETLRTSNLPGNPFVVPIKVRYRNN